HAAAVADAVTVPVTPAEAEPSEPPAPKETPMADLSIPIPCKLCKKPSIRTHPRNLICAAHTTTARCSYCKRSEGHTPGCKRKGGAKATGGGQASGQEEERQTLRARAPCDRGARRRVA